MQAVGACALFFFPLLFRGSTTKPLHRKFSPPILSKDLFLNFLHVFLKRLFFYYLFFFFFFVIKKIEADAFTSSRRKDRLKGEIMEEHLE